MKKTLRYNSRVFTVLNWFFVYADKRHCSWCGEEFTYTTKLGHSQPSMCSTQCSNASKKSRKKRRDAQLAERNPTHPRPEFDALSEKYRVPVLSVNGKLPTNLRCHYCNGKATTRDHVYPKSRGGSNSHWNLVPSCEDCNVKKSDNFTACECEFCERAMVLTTAILGK